MAGEWIPIDCNLSTKPEVLELVDETGEPQDAVIGRVVQLWLWAAMNSEDGTARMTVRRLARLIGGSDTFWAGVQRVGWLEVDEVSGTVAIPGWERRFSSSAKARVQAAVRHAKDREVRRTSAQGEGADASDPGRTSAPELRGEEKRNSSSSPRVTWLEILEAWNASRKLKPWKLDRPPKQTGHLADDPDWCRDALAAIERLPQCRFFKTPATMLQLFSPGFVDKVLAGSFDDAPGKQSGRDFADAPPPPKAFTGEVAEAFDRTRRKLAAAKEGL